MSTSNSAPLAKSKPFFRPFFFWLHLVLGCLFSLPILLLAVTGMILAFDQEIISFAEKNQSSLPATQGIEQNASPQNWQKAIITCAQATPPNAEKRIPQTLKISSKTDTSWVLEYGKNQPIIYLDPKEGKILGEGAPGLRNFFNEVMFLHRWLAMKGENRTIGKTIIGISNVIFGIIFISGVIIWIPKKFSKRAFKGKIIFNPKSKGKARQFLLHNSLSFWFSGILALIILTGSWISFPAWRTLSTSWLKGEFTPPTKSKLSNSNESKSSSRPKRLTDKELAEIAQCAQSTRNWLEKENIAWETMLIPLQTPKKGMITMRIVEDCWLASGKGTPLQVSTSGVQTQSWKPTSDLPWWQRLTPAARALHTGRYFGIFSVVLTFLASLALIILISSGLRLSFGFKRKQ